MRAIKTFFRLRFLKKAAKQWKDLFYFRQAFSVRSRFPSNYTSFDRRSFSRLARSRHNLNYSRRRNHHNRTIICFAQHSPAQQSSCLKYKIPWHIVSSGRQIWCFVFDGLVEKSLKGRLVRQHEKSFSIAPKFVGLINIYVVSPLCPFCLSPIVPDKMKYLTQQQHAGDCDEGNYVNVSTSPENRCYLWKCLW